MFSWAARLLLTASALAPVGLVYAYTEYSTHHKRAFWVFVLCAALFFGVIYLLRAAKAQLQSFPFEPASVEAADRENVAFLLLYLSPLFTAKLSSLNLSILVPTLLIFGALTLTGYSYHFNPLIGILGWHFYKVSSKEGVTYVLITRKQLRRASEIADVGQLTEYILMDLGGS